MTSAKTAKVPAQTQSKKPPVAGTDTTSVSGAKPSNQVRDGLITSPFALVFIQSNQTSKDHSRDSSHFLPAASMGLQVSSATNNTHSTKHTAKPQTTANSETTTIHSSTTKKAKHKVSPSRVDMVFRKKCMLSDHAQRLSNCDCANTNVDADNNRTFLLSNHQKPTVSSPPTNFESV